MVWEISAVNQNLGWKERIHEDISIKKFQVIIWGRRLLEAGEYLRSLIIRDGLLFKIGYYLRSVIIKDRSLFKLCYF